MRNITSYIILLISYIWLTSCSEQATPSVTTGVVTITLTGLDDDLSGLEVQLHNISTGSLFVEKSDVADALRSRQRILQL